MRADGMRWSDNYGYLLSLPTRSTTITLKSNAVVNGIRVGKVGTRCLWILLVLKKNQYLQLGERVTSQLLRTLCSPMAIFLAEGTSENFFRSPCTMRCSYVASKPVPQKDWPRFTWTLTGPLLLTLWFDVTPERSLQDPEHVDASVQWEGGKSPESWCPPFPLERND